MVAMMFAVPVATMPSNTPSENWFLIVIGFMFAVQLCVTLYGLLGPDQDSEEFLSVSEALDLTIVILCSLKVAIVDFWDPLRDHILIPFIKFLGCIEIDATKSIHEVKYDSLEDEIIQETGGGENNMSLSLFDLSKLSPQKLLSLKQKTAEGKLANGETIKKIFGDYRHFATGKREQEDLVDEELWWNGDEEEGGLDRPLMMNQNDIDDDYEEDENEKHSNNKQEMKMKSLQRFVPPPPSSRHQHDDDDDDDEYEEYEEYEDEEEQERQQHLRHSRISKIQDDSMI